MCGDRLKTKKYDKESVITQKHDEWFGGGKVAVRRNVEVLMFIGVLAVV